MVFTSLLKEITAGIVVNLSATEILLSKDTGAVKLLYAYLIICS